MLRPDLGQVGLSARLEVTTSGAVGATYLLRWSRPEAPVAVSDGLVPGACFPRACCAELGSMGLWSRMGGSFGARDGFGWVA